MTTTAPAITITIRPAIARVQNIMRVLRTATIADYVEGCDWYARARDLAIELDAADIIRAAAVIAVLSPMLSWPRNVVLARQAYMMHNDGATADEIVAALGCLKGNARKAAALLNGADIDSTVSGPKVRAFWMTIADPTGAHVAVIDRHALDIAFGRPTDDATRSLALSRKAAYGEIAAMYTRAAVLLSRETGKSYSASDIQAITWVAWRRTRAVANHG